MGNITFKPELFLKYLPDMGAGMLGVFIIIGVIIISTYAIAALTKNSTTLIAIPLLATSSIS